MKRSTSLPRKIASLGTPVATVALCAACSAASSGSSEPSDSSSRQLQPATSSSRMTASPATLDYGAAQPAVDALRQVQADYAQAVMHPEDASTVALYSRLAGQAKQAFSQSFEAAKQARVEYRGTPPTARIRVIADRTTAKVPRVDLINCPLQSTTDPFRAYTAATGKVLPSPASAVPPPYAQRAALFMINKRWVVTQYSTDATKTCSA